MSRNKPGTRSYALPDADRKRPRHAVCLPRELWERLDAEAKRRDVSRSAVIESAVVEHLDSISLPED